MKKRLHSLLVSNQLAFVLWTGFATTLAYFCMYLLRKPYTAGTYEGLYFLGIDYKVALVIAQLFGYALSKFLGIKIISELKPNQRLFAYILLMSVALLSLLGLALSPTNYGPFWLFINGLPLGMIWGVMYTYCEGRKMTEVFTVMLAANFILTSGFSKSIGKYVLSLGYDASLMPLILGICIIPLIGLAVFMLSHIPPPTEEETNSKQLRVTMDGKARLDFLKQFRVPVICFVVMYLLITIVRDIRDNFAVEIWKDLGYDTVLSVFTTSELYVTIIVLFGLGFLYRIRSHFTAFTTSIIIACGGLALLLGSTLCFNYAYLSPMVWMVATGVGLFLPYILFNGILFDRFIASYKIKGNVGFVMYLADAIGYLGSVCVMLFKNFSTTSVAWLPFYKFICITAGGGAFMVGALLLIYIFKNPAQK